MVVTLKKTIRVLILEDCEDDALLMLHEFKSSGYDAVHARVETAEDMRAALKNETWDIVLADYLLPGMNALKGLEILRESASDLPCIVVSGTIGEDVAVEAMKAGAADYIMKENLTRLVPAVERELREARLRKEHRRAAEEVRRHETERLFFLHVSEICGRVSLEVDEICREIVALVSREWCYRRDVCARIILGGEVYKSDLCADVVWRLSSGIIVRGERVGSIDVGCGMEECDCEVIEGKKEVMGNIGCRLGEAIGFKQAQRQMQESEHRFRQLVESVVDGIVLYDLEGRILMVNNSAARMSGYTREELLGMNIADYSARPVSKKEKKTWRGLAPGEYVLFEAEQRRKDGTMYPVEVNLTKIMYRDEPVLLATARDITQRKAIEEERREHIQKHIRSLEQTIQAIAVSLEMKDPYTAGHQQRVTRIAVDIAQAMGLSSERINAVSMAASVHDIGKMYIPSEILSKPSKLTEIEYSMVKLHARAGHDVLKNVEFPWPIAQIVLQHHERLDGSGYPDALRGEDILLEARIIAVADVVESMASHRPYRPSIGIEQALNEIRQNRGSLFDPDVVDACLTLFEDRQYRL